MANATPQTPEEWFTEARQRAKIQYQIQDELLQQKLELIEYYSFLKDAPPDVKHLFASLPEQNISSASRAVATRLRKGDYRFNISNNASPREILIDWAARIRALDDIVFENGDLAPSSSARWRVKNSANDVYLVPRFRPRANPRKSNTGAVSNRAMIKHRLIPARVDKWSVTIVPCKGRLTKTDELTFGAALFQDFELIPTSHPDLVFDKINCRSYPEKVRKHMKDAHDDKCNIVLFPELTIDPTSKESIRSNLRDRPWNTRWSTSLVIAGSWHEYINGKYFNVATAFDGHGNELARHEKIFRYFENKSGKGEGIELGKKLTLLAFDDFIVAIGICKDFCERVDPPRSPFLELDADLFLIPSMGGKATISGHIDSAKDIALQYRASTFVVQQCDQASPLGYVIFPTQDLDRGSSDFEVPTSWTAYSVDTSSKTL